MADDYPYSRNEKKFEEDETQLAESVVVHHQTHKQQLNHQ